MLRVRARTWKRGLAMTILLVCVIVLPGQASADDTQSLSIDDVTVNEAAGTATFTVSLSAGPDTAAVDVTTSTGSATAPADYVHKSERLTEIPAGGSKPFVVSIAERLVLRGRQVVQRHPLEPCRSCRRGRGGNRDDHERRRSAADLHRRRHRHRGTPAPSMRTSWSASRRRAANRSPCSTQPAPARPRRFGLRRRSGSDPDDPEPNQPRERSRSRSTATSWHRERRESSRSTFNRRPTRHGQRPQGTATIKDNEAAPAASIEPATMTEGDANLDLDLTVKLASPSQQTLDVRLPVSVDNTATGPTTTS